MERIGPLQSSAAFFALSSSQKNAFLFGGTLFLAQYFLMYFKVILTLPFIFILAVLNVIFWPRIAHAYRWRRIRDSISYGTPVRGKILGIRSNGRKDHPFRPPTPSTHYRLLVGYRDQTGAEHKVFEYLPWDSTKPPFPFKVGDAVTVCVDPRHPNHGTLPLLHGDGEPAPPHDNRGRLDAAPAPALLTEGTTRTIDLYDEQPGLRKPRKVGSVTLNDEALLFEDGEQRKAIELPLDKPFSLDLTAWLVSEETVAVNIEIRPHGARTRDRSARFTVHLPQSSVDARIPLQQAFLPVMEVSDFERMWPRLKALAAVHGIGGGGLLKLQSLTEQDERAQATAPSHSSAVLAHQRS